MKRVFLPLLVLGLVFFSCEKEDSNIASDLNAVEGRAGVSSVSFDMCNEITNQAVLFAGQNEPVGTVSVSVDGDFYIIEYKLNEGSEYCLSETHLAVEEIPEDFPIGKTGNPKIGNFEFSDPHPCQSMVTYEVPISNGTYIAAHAVVSCIEDDVFSLCENLPDMASFTTDATAYPGSQGAYFDITIAGGTSIDGLSPAWCADVKKPLDPGQGPFDADVYCTYEDFEYAGINKDNLDLVNWLINQSVIGTDAGNDTTYNFGDVQWAIWWLLNGAGCNTCAGLGDKAELERKGQQLADLAAANGDGFEPGCDQYFLVLLVPQNSTVQPVMIPQYIPCNECEETAWADGCDFPGGSWATYFQYGG